ncbi:MAG: hypothetical protein LQ346_004841 [Caloplaca aetnensis]|nr:MAG: hypothetical protein LQ346_004841 [Caloplaca aetnensis]
MPQTPVLPYGSPTTLSGISENFSFHSSPESFIIARVLAFQRAHPDLADCRTPIRAKVLNRNVAVLSSHDHVCQALCDESITSRLSSSQAYDELMAPFFPPPNLLLLDPPDHQERKRAWLGRMAILNETIRPLVQDVVRDHFRSIPSGSLIDLYDSMKSLSWQILLSIFLRKDEDGQGEDIAEIEALHEDLLRGQFSLFPVSINTGFWQSPRARGLQARQTLQSLLQSKVTHGKCPFAVGSLEEGRDIANHLLLFTSSLAAKALASMLTAVLTNLFLFQEGGFTLSATIQNLQTPELRSRYIQSMIREVERLSPPVVGIMRRTTEDIVLSSKAELFPPTLIPKAWDLWLYFVGAGRDPAAFGETAESFVPSRYFEAGSSLQEGLAFGTGAKTCLGKDLMRTVAATVVETCLAKPQGTEMTNGAEIVAVNLEGDGGDLPAGVQAWLGWQAKVKPEEWARDIKQLPTQRPRKPILVKVKHQLAS